ncbi:hypothetical protein N7535_003721 [Penicillium sp. DV-2018c]|nr:hypothetical protein N7461_000578 [Penicillium sp. DV-2018c]KAJ5576795.1 hypothetical protein N7535_003721 [Penicillium sp. DV-2018c]
MSDDADPSAELQSTLRNLSIGKKSPAQDKDIPRPNVKGVTSSGSTTLAPKSKPKKVREPVADSWEDEAELSASDAENVQPREQDTTQILSPINSTEDPLGPPPTPISPQTSNPWTAPARPVTSAREPPARRPEKQTAVAGRLIAGALGIRPPKRTEQQKAYDRSVKEQEIKRRNREREEKARAKEEEEKAKASIWDS